MKRLALLITVFGLLAAFFAIVLNLVNGTDPHAAGTLTVQAVVAAVAALVCGVITFRRGGGQRFLAIAMIGPAVFVLTDSGMRLLLMMHYAI